nr:hypothetical protein [Tanacetum cinerariifolium]
MDMGDDGDDDDGDSSGDDTDEEDEDEEDEEEEEEEEEHLAPADSAVVIPTDELVSPPEGTKPDEHILSAKEQPLPPVVSPTAESPGYVAESNPKEDPEEYEDDETKDGPVDYPMDRGDDGDDDDGDSYGDDTDDEYEDMDDDDEEEEEEHIAPADSTTFVPPIELALVDAVTAALPSPPLPPSLYPPPVDRRDDIPESELPPRKRVYFSTLGSRHEVGESSMRGRGEDAQDGRTRISQRVAMDSQPVDLLMRDRMTLQETISIVEEEAYDAREAWAHLIGLSQTTQHQLHETHSQIQQTEMAGLREADHVRQSQMTETLRVMGDMRREMGDMQAKQIMAPVTRQGQNPPTPNIDTPPHHMTSKSVQAIIDQALLRNFTNGDGSQSSHRDNPRNVQTTRPCFYIDFMKCHPLNIKGNEGVFDAALTWWNGQIRTLGPEAYAMTWEVKGNDVPTYTNRFQELTRICTKFVANENKKIDKYINGLLDSIYGNVKSSKPRTLDETIELTNDLMDQKLRTYVKMSDNKRKADDTSRRNHGYQQQPFKKQNVAKVYNIGTGERKAYEGSFPKCTKC